MKRKPLTLWLNPELYNTLSSLSSIVHRSMNQLVTEAVSIYVRQESKVVEQDLENRSEEHTSELQSHSFISYAVFCLKKKKKKKYNI